MIRVLLSRSVYLCDLTYINSLNIGKIILWKIGFQHERTTIESEMGKEVESSFPRLMPSSCLLYINLCKGTDIIQRNSL